MADLMSALSSVSASLPYKAPRSFQLGSTETNFGVADSSPVVAATTTPSAAPGKKLFVAPRLSAVPVLFLFIYTLTTKPHEYYHDRLQITLQLLIQLLTLISQILSVHNRQHLQLHLLNDCL